MIWYSPAAFEAAGYTVPATWDELVALVDQMAADGNVAWSMGMESGDATGWTGTDFIQDILLVTQGPPDFVNKIISGEIAYNDPPAVKEAYEIYGKWAMDPAYTVAGAEGTLSTGFNDAILKVFSDTPPKPSWLSNRALRVAPCSEPILTRSTVSITLSLACLARKVCRVVQTG